MTWTKVLSIQLKQAKYVCFGVLVERELGCSRIFVRCSVQYSMLTLSLHLKKLKIDTLVTHAQDLEFLHL